MNDWWNDPPESPDLPECCDLEMIVFEDGVCLCECCGLRIAPAPEWDPGPEPVFEELDDYPEGPEHCPHGKAWGQCDACDYLSDIAYDAARENRYR